MAEERRDTESDVILREVNERLVISSLRELESAELAERRKAQLHALLEALHDGVVIAEPSGRVRMVNAAACESFGLVASAPHTVESIGVLPLRHLDHALFARDEHPLNRAIRGETFSGLGMLLLRSDGKLRRLLASGTSTKEGDQVELAILVVKDETASRDLEERLQHAERLAAIGTLSAGIAHEINNPLTFVLANVDIALEEVRAVNDRLRAIGDPQTLVAAARLGELDAALTDAKEGSLRVHRIIADLRRFGRLDDSKHSVVEIVDVLESAIRITANQARLHAEIRRDYEATPAVSANEGQLVQVFVNLLMNAIQAVGDASCSERQIVVASYTDDVGRAVAEVRDSGPGVPEAIHKRIFEPFFTTKSVGQGSGLGLSVCYSVVRALGGAIEVDSNEARGATFRVTLPAATVAAREPIAVAVAPVSAAPRRGRVLVIDDEPAVGRVVGRVLERDHDVSVVCDAADALARIAAGESFDVVLCDLMMPGITGQEFFRVLSQRNADLARRVVFLTGGAVTPHTDEFLRTTPNVTLLKPFAPCELRRLVVEYLRPVV